MLYRWSGSYLSWSFKYRLQHVTTGRYLGVTADGELALIPRGRSDVDTTAFYLLKSKVRSNFKPMQQQG